MTVTASLTVSRIQVWRDWAILWTAIVFSLATIIAVALTLTDSQMSFVHQFKRNLLPSGAICGVAITHNKGVMGKGCSIDPIETTRGGCPDGFTKLTFRNNTPLNAISGEGAQDVTPTSVIFCWKN